MPDVPRYVDEQTANLPAGLKRGFTPPRITLKGRDASLEPFTDPDPAKNPFFDAFEMMHASIPAAEQARLKAEATALIRDRIEPDYTKLLAFIRNDYILNTRTTTDRKSTRLNSSHSCASRMPPTP